jgi:hypothetical protein
MLRSDRKREACRAERAEAALGRVRALAGFWIAQTGADRLTALAAAGRAVLQVLGDEFQ